MTQAAKGEPYDVDNLPKEPLSKSWIWKSIIIGAIIAFVITGYMRMQLKTVRKQMSAMSYVKDDSMNITNSRDMFLYRRVTRTAKPKIPDRVEAVYIPVRRDVPMEVPVEVFKKLKEVKR